MTGRNLRDSIAGRVLSRCWCDTNEVWVTLDEVRAGLTRPCRLARCRRMASVRAAEDSPTRQR